MESFSVQGKVKNGTVVFETPIDLPDGTVVTVDYDPIDELRSEECEPHDPAKAREILFAFVGRPELANDPEWRSKLQLGSRHE